MKKLNSFFLIALVMAFGGMIVASCGGGRSGGGGGGGSRDRDDDDETTEERADSATYEEDVKKFSQFFVDMARLNQMDSLASYYPGIAIADSLISITTPNILVKANSPSEYDVTVADGISLIINRDDNGKFTVTGSKGLFMFNPNRVELAKKTGMWDESLSDVEFNSRIKDEEFFNYLSRVKSVNSENIITIGRFVNRGNGTGYYPITNNTDIFINGSDYDFEVISTYPTYDGWAIDEWVTERNWEDGKNLAPHQTIYFDTEMTYSFEVGEVDPEKEIESIDFNMTEEELLDKFATFTGTEYQEYLNSTK